MSTTNKSTSKRKYGSNAVVTILAVAGILILLNFFISPKIFGRIDLTDSKIHTLSDASKEAAASLADLTIKVYISDPLPDALNLGTGNQPVSIRGVANTFRDKLEEYKAYSNGNMKILYVTENVKSEAEEAKIQLFGGSEATIASGRLEFSQYACGATFHNARWWYDDEYLAKQP